MGWKETKMATAIILLIVWTMGALLIAFVGIGLTRIGESHRPFYWTKQRILMALFSSVWPISLPIFIVSCYLKKDESC